MGVKDSFLAPSILVKIAFIVALIGNILNWIAFTTSSWSYNSGSGLNGKFYLGLWRQCSQTSCAFLDGTSNDSLAAVQAFAIFGFISLNVGLLLLVFLIFLDKCKGNAETRLAAAILFIFSAITWLVSIIIFGADYYDKNLLNSDLGFSFALAIVSLVFALVSGILLFIEANGKGSIGQKS